MNLPNSQYNRLVGERDALLARVRELEAALISERMRANALLDAALVPAVAEGDDGDG